MEDRTTPSTAYIATDLVSDQPGVAALTDPTLVNAWGISLNPNGGAFWVSSNGKNLSELYLGDVGGGALNALFKVAVPGGAPTGQVFNNTGSTTDFLVSDGTASAAAVFIFASEAGTVTAWNPGIGLAPGASPPSLTAETVFTSPDGAIYKGISLDKDGKVLFLADFHNGKIDVLDSQFDPIAHGTAGFGDFTDPNLPRGFAPFNVAVINGKLYVAYAKQDADAEDDVAGKGNGFISVFDLKGNFQQRLASRGELNSPWAIVQAPAGFGDFANKLLVGNFGDGHINVFDATTGKDLGVLSEAPGRPIVIDGLWGLAFGNGKTAGDAGSLYYAAGPDGETHGLFGRITANAAGTSPVTARLAGADLLITGSRNDDRVFVTLDHSETTITVTDHGQQIGQFKAEDVGTIRFSGLAGDDVFGVDRHLSAVVIADGGAGNDVLLGGNAGSILLGGPGRDLLSGGAGRDILIGGDGTDRLLGGRNDDILIGGQTKHDADQAALLQILAGWNTAASYSARVAAIRAGAGGVPALDAANVLDDGVRDVLEGGSGLDWFLGADPDVFAGKKANEQVN